MSVKRKDFQKIASTIQHFLLKLTDTNECAELRDSLNLSLLQLQKYYRKYLQRLQNTGRGNLENSGGSGYVSPRQSLRITLSRSRDETLSPMTPYIEEPQYFHAHWTVIEEKAQSFRRSIPEEDLNSQRLINTPPVHYAAMTADFELLTELHMGKIDILEDQDCIGRTPMMYAAYYNKITVVRWLLDRDVNPNSCDFNEVTALHWSCSQGHSPIIELLLAAGADKDYQDSFGRSASHWACTISGLEPLQLLIEFDANINLHDRNGLTPAMWACRLDHLDHLRLLSSVKNQRIDHIDGYERDRNGRTTVHWSIRRQQPLECLKYLLNEETAQLKDDEGKTVLLLAAEQGCLESCKVIVEFFGARFLSDVDDKDRTCLHLATIGGHGEVVNYMLEIGMNVNIKDKTGATCMEIARNQFLFYCQLIISSHIREKERKLDSVASDNVEVIEKIISRHNSISESRNRVLTPPRVPKSPKVNKPIPKSPNHKRQVQSHGSDTPVFEVQSNGFDAMSSDPIINGFGGHFSPNSTKNSYEKNNEDDVSKVAMEEPSPEHFPENLRYVEAENIDFLDNDTGQQYHLSQVKDQRSSSNLSVDVNILNLDSNPETKIPKRTLKRAQKENRIHSDRSDRDSDQPSVNTPLPAAPIQPIERESSGLRQMAISSPPLEANQRINFGATLEPIKLESQLNLRRKKKRSNRPRKIVSQSQDRFPQSQNADLERPLCQAMSVDTINLKYMDQQRPNGIITKKPFPPPIISPLEHPSRNPNPVHRNDPSIFVNSYMKPGDRVPWGVEQSEKTNRRQPKLSPPVELSNHRFVNSSFPNL